MITTVTFKMLTEELKLLDSDDIITNFIDIYKNVGKIRRNKLIQLTPEFILKIYKKLDTYKYLTINEQGDYHWIGENKKLNILSRTYDESKISIYSYTLEFSYDQVVDRRYSHLYYNYISRKDYLKLTSDVITVHCYTLERLETLRDSFKNTKIMDEYTFIKLFDLGISNLTKIILDEYNALLNIEAYSILTAVGAYLPRWCMFNCKSTYISTYKGGFIIHTCSDINSNKLSQLLNLLTYENQKKIFTTS